MELAFSDVTGKRFNFAGPVELAEFLGAELKFWAEWRERIPKGNHHPYCNSAGLLQVAKKALEPFLEKDIDLESAEWGRQASELNGHALAGLRSKWLYSAHAYSTQFVECCVEHGGQAAATFFAFVNKRDVNPTNRQEFIGVLLGYEFEHPGAEFSVRRKGEQASIEALRARLEEKINEAVGELEHFKAASKDWSGRVDESWSEWRDHSENDWAARSTRHGVEHGELLESKREEFDAYLAECSQKITDLESTYREKLRLEAPVKYWSEAKEKHGVQGGLYLCLLVALFFVGVVQFHDFFVAWLKGRDIGVQLNTLQGLLLFAGISTVFAFFAKTLSRLVFSSYHLMRDAQERETLTYLYLALVKDGIIDIESRDIVLQALFSRADSGLIGGDSGPTMPGVADLLKQQARYGKM